MSLLLVYNPRAGGNRAAPLLQRIRERLEAADKTVRVVSSSGAADTVPFDAEGIPEGCSGVVAAGGDGTVFGTLNALYRLPASARPPLGVIPIGTGNAFARDLGLAPGDWESAVGLLIAGRTRKIDVGHVRSASAEFHFLNVVGAGFVVDAGRAAHRLKRIGRSAYTLGALWRIGWLRQHRWHLKVDGKPVEAEGPFVNVSNTRFTGTRFLIAPRARPDDGLLDLTLIRRVSRTRLLRLFPTVYEGRHVTLPEVHIAQARTIEIDLPAGLPLMADGEFIGTLPARIRCLPSDLDVFCA